MKKYWFKWKVISKKIGNFQTKIIFSILYFLIIFPLGFIVNFFNDFFEIRKYPAWENFKNNLKSLDDMKNQ